tara:strand:+ start:8969 stop:9166 length:198 start_codon:yes stop_codon:yes gene_type:complete
MNVELDPSERIKMSMNDRIAADKNDRDALLERQLILESRINILMDKFHEYEDRMDILEKRHKKRA